MDRYLPGPLKDLVGRIAAAVGVPPGDAELFADALVEADLTGASTHGVSRLAIYVKRMEKGLIDPAASLKIDRRRGATLAVDACNGLGQVQAARTLDLLIPMARESGIASATVRRSQHFGAASYFCNRAADRDMILLATTNCEPSMSPEGGCAAFFGTNPIAMSFPTGKGFHVKVDLATSLVARGNIIAAQRRGQAIPPGWALDPDGNPTTDAGAALAGTVLAMAGHKGYALALMVEALSGVLSGAAVGPDVGSMYKQLDREQDVGHFFCLMDISAFMDLEQFKSRIDRMIEQIKTCRRRANVEEILVPGERSARTAAEAPAKRRFARPGDRCRIERAGSPPWHTAGSWTGDRSGMREVHRMQRILVPENIAGNEMDALRRRFDVAWHPDLWKEPEKLRAAVADAQAIIVRNQTKVNAELIGAAGKLAVIGRAGVGLDNVDCAAASAAGVVVAYTPEQNSISVAELAIGMMLALARTIPAADASAKSGAWDRKRFMGGVELYGKVIGIVGMGRIGFLTAMRAARSNGRHRVRSGSASRLRRDHRDARSIDEPGRPARVGRFRLMPCPRDASHGQPL